MVCGANCLCRCKACNCLKGYECACYNNPNWCECMQCGKGDAHCRDSNNNQASQALLKASASATDHLLDRALRAAWKTPDFMPEETDFAVKYEKIFANLQEACADRFLAEFGYELAGERTQPPQGTPGPVFESFIGCNTPSPENISNYIKRAITKDIPLPDSTKDAATASLVSFISSSLVPGMEDFVLNKYEQSFPVPSEQNADGVLNVHVVTAYYDMELPEHEPNPTRFFFLFFCGLGVVVEN
ncbi:predicted protein [Uncinocarpus reesii 1704]|uniref:Uncharacterized protein n=1 Tax=Uncinocarpus reesii (strain UAMH 1704) TaxID=336963 RepID=C4JY57_UNCRE|nr:uncharacterized protein UREG_07108 [Uncinocarpus reesii 1704]EEP82243.1 predicted protein [Uncinocarpus reesii 1704]